MIDIDEVIEQFDQYLDEYNNPVEIEGHVFAASEALNTLSFKAYLAELDKFIQDNFIIVSHDGDSFYERISEVKED